MGSTLLAEFQQSTLTPSHTTMQPRTLNICKLVCGVTGLVLVVLGVSIKWGIFPTVVNSMVLKTLQLDPDNSDTWEAWVEPPIDPYMKFTFFNVSNTADVKAGIAKPIVTEVGPFAYKEVRRKENILSIQDEISFGSYIHYEFDEAESCESCRIDTEVTVINPVMVIISTLVEEAHETVWPDINIPGLPHVNFDEIMDTLLETIGGILNEMVKCEQDAQVELGWCDDMWLTATPDEMIFQGTHSGIITSLNFFLHDTTTGAGLPSLIWIALINYSGNHTEQLPADKVPSPDEIVNLIDTLLDSLNIPPLIDLEQGSFGFFKGTNATKSWWKINNGKYDMTHFNEVLEYNGMTKLPESWWENFGPTPSAHKSGVPGICHDIIGTDGMGYAPNVDKNSDVWLFNDQLCRSIWLTYQEEVDVHGIKTYQYSPDPSVFSMSNPDNYCYCPKVSQCAKPNLENDTWDMSACEICKDGILSLQGCQGAPVVMSTPHFLDADPSLHEAIDGLDPVREKHVTFLNLEPRTGMPLQAHKRIQISVPVFPSTYFTALGQAKQNIFPLVWVDEGADIAGDSLKMAKKMLVTPFVAVDAGCGVMIGLGGLAVIAVILHSVFAKK